MFTQVFKSVLQASSYVWGIFITLMDTFGFGGLLLTLFSDYCVYRFLLKPLIGSSSSSSDKVKKPKQKKGG